MQRGSAAHPPRPRARRTVIAVAAATLLGFVAVDAMGRFVFPGEEYAAAAALRPMANERVGSVGGLVPHARLTVGSRVRDARDLRPAVLMLVPYPCECSERLEHVVAQTDGTKVRLYAIGSAGPIQMRHLAAEAEGQAVGLFDKAGVLSRTYPHGRNVKLVLVRRDGVVTEIIDDVTTEIDLLSRLPELLELP